MELRYGLVIAKMTDFFWELIKILVDKYCHTIMLRPILVHNRCAMYDASLAAEGCPFENWLDFIDCTKNENFMSRWTICKPT